MRFKTSCFNPALAKNSLRRFWPLPLCILAFYLVTFALPLYNQLHFVLQNNHEAEILAAQMLDSTISLVSVYNLYGVVLLAGLSLLSALLVLRHLHSRRDIQFFLALPVKRRCLFLTSVVTGYLMVLAPTLLGQAVGAIVCLSLGTSAMPLLQLMLVSLVSVTLFFGMAVLSCVLAGQSLGAILVFGGMNVAVFAIFGGAGAVAERFLLGFRFGQSLPDLVSWLTPIRNLGEALVRVYEPVTSRPLDQMALNWPCLIAYGVAGPVLTVLAGVLYQCRKGETAGEMLSFQWVRVLCKLLATLAVSMGLSMIVLEILTVNQEASFGLLLGMVLIFAAVGWIAAEMIIQKTFRVFHKRSLLQGGALLLVLLALLCGAKLDLFGYTSRVPKNDDIETAYVTCNGLFAQVQPEEARQLHETLLDNRSDLCFDFSGYTAEVDISYMLKDGSTLRRVYSLRRENATPALDAVNELFSRPENNWQTWFLSWEDGLSPDWDKELTVENFESAYVCNSSDKFTETEAYIAPDQDRFYGDPSVSAQEWYLTAQDAITVYQAILRDLEAGNLRPQNYLYADGQWSQDDYLGYIQFFRYEKAYDPSVGAYSSYLEETGTQGEMVDIYETMTYTIEALEQIGLQLR